MQYTPAASSSSMPCWLHRSSCWFMTRQLMMCLAQGVFKANDEMKPARLLA
jgi:hypothetical protein